MKAVDFLKQQRDEVERLFGELEQASGEEKTAIRARIATVIAAHVSVEEELFYFLARKALSIDPFIRKGENNVGKHGVLELCFTPMPRSSRHDARSFDPAGAMLTGSSVPMIDAYEQKVLNDDLAKLGAQMAERFRQHTTVDTRKLLEEDGSRQAMMAPVPTAALRGLQALAKQPRRLQTVVLRFAA